MRSYAGNFMRAWPRRDTGRDVDWHDRGNGVALRGYERRNPGDAERGRGAEAAEPARSARSLE